MNFKEEKKYYNLKDNINIFKENNYILNNDKIYDEVKFEKELLYNRIIDATGFSAIVNILLASRQNRGVVGRQQGVVTPPTTGGQGQPGVQSQPDVTAPQGQAYDVDNMWSPESWAGNIYEWNRGVIAINQHGVIAKENIDGTFKHHGGATVRTLNAVGISIKNDVADMEPFKVAVDGSNRGAVVFQSEGDTAFIYLPATLNAVQISSLESILLPRQDFHFAFTHNGMIYEEQSFQEIMTFVGNLNNFGIKRTA